MSTIIASFANPDDAEKAVGALLDRGAKAIDISVLENEITGEPRFRTIRTVEAADAEDTAKSGITTTTPADAGMGAAKGTVAGVALGILGAAAALFIPGVGLVVGGGALASAVMAAAGTAAAGAAAGAVYGYLKDQGMGEELAARYAGVLNTGGSLVAIAVPTGEITPELAETILAKYGATEMTTNNMPRTSIPPSMSDVDVVPGPPIAPEANTVTGSVVPPPPPSPSILEPDLPPGTRIQDEVAIDERTGETSRRTEIEIPVSGAVEPRTVSRTPEAGTTLGPHTVDPLTGNVRQPTVVETTPVIVPSSLQVRPTLVDPNTGAVLEGVVVDPVSGSERPVRMQDGQMVYAAPQVTETTVVTTDDDMRNRVSLE